jgi:hypothetical protein
MKAFDSIFNMCLNVKESVNGINPSLFFMSISMKNYLSHAVQKDKDSTIFFTFINKIIQDTDVYKTLSQEISIKDLAVSLA